MINHEFRESADNLLRPNDVERLQDESKQIESMINAPRHVAEVVENRGALIRRLHTIKQQIEDQAPKPYAAQEIDSAVFREEALRAAITEAMPTQAEMRRKPAGAVDRHLTWEQRCKKKLLEWKNIRLRLHAGGNLSLHPLARDVCNIEMFRPSKSSTELGMHSAEIPGKSIFLPPDAKPATIMSDLQRAVLTEIMPDLASKMAVLDSEARRSILDMVDTLIALGEDQQKKAAEAGAEENPITERLTGALVKGQERAAKRAKPLNLSDEERERRSQRMKDRWAAKRAAEAEAIEKP